MRGAWVNRPEIAACVLHDSPNPLQHRRVWLPLQLNHDPKHLFMREVPPWRSHVKTSSSCAHRPHCLLSHRARRSRPSHANGLNMHVNTQVKMPEIID
jgi:hypothetical protein